MAGKMNTSGRLTADLWHPSWCDGARCAAAAGGTHQSAPTVVRLDGGGVQTGQTATVHLSQRPWAAGLPDPVPLLHVEFHDPDDEEQEPQAVVLRLDPARALAWVLRSLVRQADL